jgi:hypothetical protein
MGSDDRDDIGMSEKRSEGLPPPASAQSEKQSAGAGLHSSVYIVVWIAMSGSVILFNKWVLSTAEFSELSSSYDTSDLYANEGAEFRTCLPRRLR